MTEEYDYDPFISGGVAGLLAWTLSYPIDVIKNRQMAKNIDFKSALKEGVMERLRTMCYKSSSCKLSRI